MMAKIWNGQSVHLTGRQKIPESRIFPFQFARKAARRSDSFQPNDVISFTSTSSPNSYSEQSNGLIVTHSTQNSDNLSLSQTALSNRVNLSLGTNSGINNNSTLFNTGEVDLNGHKTPS